MRFKKEIAAALSVALIAGSAAGCSANQSTVSSGAPGAESVTLQFYDWSDEKDYMQKAVAEFNKQDPKLQVNLNIINAANNEYKTKMLVMLSGGADLDVYCANGTSDLLVYTSKEALEDITDRVKQANINVSAYGPSFQDIVGKTGDKYYALPYRASAYALFYNKDVFDGAKQAYPQQMTWSQYADLAKKLTSGSGADEQWGGYFADWMEAPFGALQSGSSLIDDSQDANRDWLSFLNRIYNVDKSHMSYKQMKAEKTDWLKEFESGKVAMMPNGEWTINMLNADIASGKCKISYGVAPFPIPDGSGEAVTVGGDSTFVGVYSKSKNKDAAFRFVQFLSGEEGESIIAKSGVLPAYNSSKTKETFLSSTGVDGSDYFFNVKKTVEENQLIDKMSQINQLNSEQRGLYLLGQQSLDDTMKDFTEQRKSILGE